MLNLKGTIQALLSLTLIGWATPVLSSPIHVLIDVRGNVQVKKTQWKGFHKAESGITLSGEDKIKLRSNASVTVYCSDLNQRTVEQAGTYPVSEVCPEREAVIRLCPDCNNTKTRDITIVEEELKKLPYLISPRDTYVFNEPLTIRWNEVPGATSYKVKVEDWERETNETQILYDGKLDPGESYFVTVVANNGATSAQEDDHADHWFIVLEDEEAKSLREQVVLIKQQELTQEQEGLILAYFYRGNELNKDNRLNFEVIQALEGLVKSGIQTATVYQLLGDTYRRAGLSLVAKEVYQQGLALTVEEEMSEVKAMMQLGLGKVEDVLGNRNKAAEWLQNARASYLALAKSYIINVMKRKN